MVQGRLQSTGKEAGEKGSSAFLGGEGVQGIGELATSLWVIGSEAITQI